jgi:hypothetical protein
MPVLGPAPRGEIGDSGEWIGHIERSGNRLLAWVHDETGDRWDAPITSLRSVSMAVSENDGKSWRRLGQIITGTEGVVQGKVTGVSGAVAIDGKDGYYYTYSYQQTQPGGVIVSRAPVTNPGPGNWKKYFNGSWSEPGLGGKATFLENTGAALVSRVGSLPARRSFSGSIPMAWAGAFTCRRIMCISSAWTSRLSRETAEPGSVPTRIK